MRRFSGWHEPIAAVADASDENAILRNDVYYLEPLPRWSDGRVVLVGDAAHATTRGVGQGAAQAIEDAVVLADRLAATALTGYEAIRRPRAEAVLKVSRRADKAAQLASRLGWRLRNTLVRWLPERASGASSSRSSATSCDEDHSSSNPTRRLGATMR
jgi:2-polyprenyl-6-methoxyphenol hydroxylase-like FAD-dependent oxidoreductase